MSDQEQRSDSQQGSVKHENSQSPRPSRSRSRSRTPRSRSRSRSRHRRSYTRSRSRSRSRRHRRYRSRSRSRSPRHRRYSRGRRSHSRSPMSNRRRHVGNRENPPTSRCLGIFGLSLYTQERDLRDVFSKYGNVEDVQIVYDAQTGRSRGFAFIYFEQSEDAKLAKERCTGMEVDGRRIRVDFSITQRAHTPTPGIYMGKPTYTGGRYGGGSGGGNDSSNNRDGGGGGSGGEGGRNYRRSPSPYYRRSRYSRSRSRSYSPQFEERTKRKKV